MSGADFTRTCSGCEQLTTEPWVKIKFVFVASPRGVAGAL